MEIPTSFAVNPIFRFRTLLVSFMVSLTVLAGCASDTSYDRHNKSRLWLSQDGKELYFDATVSQAFPEDSAQAEVTRLGWLEDWIKLRKYCVEGYTVTERRLIRPEEYNPQRHDLRYQIKCTE